MTLPITTGIEIELWVTDQYGQLADGSAIADSQSRIEGEFVPCLLEVKTKPHETETGLREDLYTILRTAIEKAAQNGLRLVPFGTPLTETRMAATTPRGRLFEDIYGEGVIAAKNCAGSHIHFEKSNVRRQLNLLTALDPMLALVSASPYYRGERDLDCSRANAYRSNCGHDFQQFCRLREYVDSLEEWTERTDQLYDNFCDLACACGVRRSTVTEQFCAENTVLNPVRLQQKQPTVEWRAPDSTLPSQILSLAVDMGSLVAQTDTKPLEYGEPGVTEDRIGVPDFDTLQRLSRLAIRSGCHTPPVSEYIERMGVDVDKYAPVSPNIEGPAMLSDAAARRERLKQSERLVHDLRTLKTRRATDPLRCPQISDGWVQPKKSVQRINE